MPKKLTTIEFIEKANNIHNFIYDYSKVEYINSGSKIKIKCHEHGEFIQEPSNHLSGCGCPCCGQLLKNKKITLTTKEFIKRATKKHGFIFDYSKIEYKTANQKVKIICLKHGEFNQRAADHLKGDGCPICKNRKTTEQFIAESIKIHEKKYDYSKVEYINHAHRVQIICSKHGIFAQFPSSHLSGKGCYQCGVENKRYTSDEFFQKADKKYGCTYDYSKSKYINFNTEIIICCKEHGDFLQTPYKHLTRKTQCPLCKIITSSISKQETKWLDSLGVPHLYRQKKITLSDGRIIKTDAFDPTTNTVYEYWGDYWHGNPKIFDSTKIHPKRKIPFGDLYKETENKIKLIKESGYALIEKWESD